MPDPKALKDGPCECYPEPGFHDCGCGLRCVRFFRLATFHKIPWSPPVHLGGVHWALKCVLSLASKAKGRGLAPDRATKDRAETPAARPTRDLFSEAL